MKTILLLCALAVCLTGCARFGARSRVKENFDQVAPGELPFGWRAGITGQGADQWAVVADPSAPSAPNVLEQSGRVASHVYPWCVDTNLWLKDGFVEVKFKPISGKEDQAGGVVWHWQDANHYYIARGNALETNVILFRMIDGVRSEAHRVPFPIAANQWHKLRAEFHGDRIVIRCDGRPVMDWKDDSLPMPGAAGVWTKADSVVRFDDFRAGD